MCKKLYVNVKSEKKKSVDLDRIWPLRFNVI